MKPFVLCVVALGVCAGASYGSATIYAVNNLGNAGPGQNQNTLVMFNSANPAGFTTIGATGIAGAGFAGLDFAGFGGGLYGYVGYGTVGTFGLYSINTNTGAASVVGSLSGQALQDLAWNPVNNTMYGIEGANLFTVNLGTGAVQNVGTFTGFAGTPLNVGLAIDSQGRFFVHDLAMDRIYRSNAPGGLALSTLYTIPADTNFSQGMTIDWSRDDRGYHAAIGNAPQFFSRLYEFDANGAFYSLLGNFTPNGVFPTFEGGDLAIMPVPTPGAAALLGLAGLAGVRRRR